MQIRPPACTILPNGVSDCGRTLGPRVFFVAYLFLSKVLLVPVITGTLVNAFFDTIDDMRSHLRCVCMYLSDGVMCVYIYI